MAVGRAQVSEIVSRREASTKLLSPQLIDSFRMKTLQAKILDPTHLELSEPISTRPGQSISISIPIEEEVAEPGSAVEANRLPGNSIGSTNGRHRELAWRRLHPEVLQRFEGEWVVLEGEEIIDHGQDPVEIVERARAQGIETPYVFFVEELGPDIVKMGL